MKRNGSQRARGIDPRSLARIFQPTARSLSVRQERRRELTQRLVLDLADALAGQAERLADLLEGLGGGVVQAVAHAEDGGLALVHLVEAGQEAYADPNLYPIDNRGMVYSYAYIGIKRLGAGQFYSIEELTLSPRPAQLGGPPVWIGGRSKAAFRRAGRVGDGWLASSVTL